VQEPYSILRTKVTGSPQEKRKEVRSFHFMFSNRWCPSTE